MSTASVPERGEDQDYVVLSEHRPQDRRVAAATLIGTTIEWYDYFIYAYIAGMVFPQLFFKGQSPSVAQIIAFATIGISFLFRPLGAIVSGHLGDRIGRKKTLVLTLVMMGVATGLIGCLPTSAQIGAAAPLLVILLRVLQGFSAGGEWGGAALMAVEHAPAEKRGRFGSFPQIGVPIGLILATLILSIMTTISGKGFITWGWRVPFLLSFLLIFIGLWVRLGVDESPVFKAISQEARRSKLPIALAFKVGWKEIILAALLFMANNAMGYMVTSSFVAVYSSTKHHLGKTDVLNVIALAAAFWLLFTLIAGWLSDKIGRKKTYLVGWVLMLLFTFPMFYLIERGNLMLLALGLILMTLPLGFTYGPQAAAYAEMFPTAARYSGAALGYAIGAVIGGAFAPTIAQALLDKYGTLMAVGVYLAIVTVISLVATFFMRDRTGQPLEHAEYDQAIASDPVAANPDA